MKECTFTLYVRVYDEEALFEHALQRAIEDGLSSDYALDLLKTDGEIDVSACLTTILDPGVSPPGCEIQDSQSEVVWASAEQVK